MQQALERQIVFEDHKEAYALLGDRDEFLQVLRENFDCQFISRGEQLDRRDRHRCGLEQP